MRWTLRKKILFGYGLVLLLLALVLVWAFANLLRLGTASEAILSENYQSIRAADDMLFALERQDSGVLLYLLNYEDEGLEQYQQYQTTFAEQLGRAKGNVTIEGEQAVLDQIDALYEEYLSEFRVVVGGSAAPDSAYRNRMLPIFLDVRQTADRLRRLNQETMVQASNRTEDVAAWAEWTVAGIGLGALLLGLVFSLVLSNRLVRPIRRMREAALQIAKGDYDVTVPARGSDEIGQLAAQFNDMAAQLRAFTAMNLERTAAEQRKTETVIESIDDGVVAVDTDLHVLNMNPAAARPFGADAEAARGRHFLEVVGDRRLFEYVKETVETGRPPSFEREEDFLTVEHSGRTRHYQFNVTPIFASSEGQQGAVLLLRDVTKLRKLDQLKSEFVATASHELKTPLTSIGMSIELLSERLTGKLDENNGQLMEAASEEVVRLRALVEDLLSLSKIEGGHVEMHPASMRVKDVAERTLHIFQAQAEERGVDLRAEVPEDLPDAWADAEKIQQVLTNLVSNALRHTEVGGRVRVRAEAAGENLRVIVEDSGSGISLDAQEHIFDKFTQFDGEDSVGGTGLGLAICQEIVERHGGEIAVDSAPGEGATFTFTLPRADTAAGVPEPAETEESAQR